jgi:hypothetical protein
MAWLSRSVANDQPNYFSLLTDADRRAYHDLKSSFWQLDARTSRSHQAASFNEIIRKIRQYAIRGDYNDPKRSLVCGLVCMSDSIAFNTRQLCRLVGKCKSSINSSLQAIGSGPITMTPVHVRQLIQLFPFMKGLGLEMRQWTIRTFPAPDTAIPAAKEDVEMDFFSIEFEQEESEDFFETA